jgi:hypothetical protein
MENACSLAARPAIKKVDVNGRVVEKVREA